MEVNYSVEVPDKEIIVLLDKLDVTLGELNDAIRRNMAVRDIEKFKRWGTVIAEDLEKT